MSHKHENRYEDAKDVIRNMGLSGLEEDYLLDRVSDGLILRGYSSIRRGSSRVDQELRNELRERR